MAESLRSKLEKTRASMENERSSFKEHWRECGDFINPRRPRWTTSDVNKGDIRNNRIINSTATFAADTLSAGMMSGLTSPSRPWFRLTTHDPAMAESENVKMWLHTTTRRMLTVMERSNIYSSFPVIYHDLGTFGNGAMFIEEDPDDVIRTGTFPIGSYSISCNERGIVDGFSRCFMMTVRQIVGKFGKKKWSSDIDWTNISEKVKNSWGRGDTEQWYEIVHMIIPHPEDMESDLLVRKRYASVWYEIGAPHTQTTHLRDDEENKFLRKSGYDTFPIMVPRWRVNGEDSWATSWPAATALGDVKQLQHDEKKGAKAVDKMVDPPMIGPSSLKNVASTILPGGITYVDVHHASNTFRPAHEVRFDLSAHAASKQAMEQRIKRAFLEDMFLALIGSDKKNMTATEVQERATEKMWILGPTLERMNDDMLSPTVDITFEFASRAGWIPPAPPELDGVQLKVEYTSIMSEAQKAVGLNSVEKFFMFAGQAAAVNPDALDKLNIDQMIDVYGDMIGIPPGIVVPDDQVAAVRAERQKQAEQQDKLNKMQQGAATAKDLSQASTEGDNALAKLAQG